MILNTPLIIESGISGIWTYRKWSDGTAELWGLTTITSESGQHYYDLNLPFPIVDLSQWFGVAGLEDYGRGSSNNTTEVGVRLPSSNTIRLHEIKENNYSGTQPCRVYFKGFWK